MERTILKSRRVGLGARGTLLAAALLICVWAGDAASQADERFREVTDAATGIRLSLPAELVKETRTKWGTNWSASDRTINLDTLSYPEDQSFTRLYDNLKGIRGRKLERDTFNDSSFTLAGRDADGSRFHIEMRRQGAKIRGYSLVYAARSKDQAARAIERLAESFAAFPGSPAADARTIAAQPPPRASDVAAVLPRGPSIAVQPNLSAGRHLDDGRLSPDGRILATSDRQRITIWDLVTGRVLRTLEHHAYITGMRFTHDGGAIATAHKDGTVRLWRVETGETLHVFQVGSTEDDDPATALTFDRTGRTLVVATEKARIFGLDIPGRTRAWDIRFSSKADDHPQLKALHLSDDGGQLVAAGREEAKWFDVRTRRELRAHKLAKESKLEFFKNGILGTAALLVFNGSYGCDAELLLADFSASTPDLVPLEGKASSCSNSEDGWVGQLKVFHGAAKRQLFVSRHGLPGTTVVDLAQPRSQRRLPWPAVGQGTTIAVSDDLGLGATFSDTGIKLWRPEAALLLKDHSSQTSGAENAVISADRQSIVIYSAKDDRKHFASWQLDGFAPRFRTPASRDGIVFHALSSERGTLAGIDESQKGEPHLVLVSAETGRELQRVSLGKREDVWGVRISPDGKRVLVQLEGVLVIDAETGRTLKTIRAAKRKGDDQEEGVRSITFSPDGRLFAIGWDWESSVQVWDSLTLSPVATMPAHDDCMQATTLLFSASNRYIIGGSRDAATCIWDIGRKKLVRTYERTVIAGHVNTASLAMSRDGKLLAAGPGQRAVSSGDVGRESGIHVWDVATGKLRFVLRGHEMNVSALAFTPDDRWLVSGSYDGTVRYWDRETGRTVATFATSGDGRWVIVTDRGFFAASANAGDLLSVVRGYEATSIEQMWQSLYAPDLVREHIGGDPSGEVKVAEANANLEKVLDSGPVPDVSVLAPTSGSASSQDLIEVRARINDKGKGVGRVEWRVNGVTVGVLEKPEGAGPEHTPSRQLALDPGNNTVEVVAYNGPNLLASLPARVNVTYTGPADGAKPRLHVLAIGINEYTDPGVPDSRHQGFAKLTLAVKDAETLAGELKRAAAGLYAGEPNIVVLRDHEATRNGIAAAIDRMARDIHQRDTFVLFAAGHGISKDGHFYLIPQDHKGGDHRVMLKRHAIGQDMLQDWLANRIRAKRAIVLLDTCESGALVGGHVRARSEAAASEAGIGRLHETTGRPVLTAAATGEFARGGLIGAAGVRHGVFTWALLDALRKGDTNGDGSISLSELVQHVQTVVPREAKRVGGVAEARGSGARDAQSARFGSRGEDFVVVNAVQ